MDFSKHMRPTLVLLNLLALLAFVNYSAYRNEQLLAQGRLVLLQLAPVDPRSLMQGDYMALAYQAAREHPLQPGQPLRGYVVLAPDGKVPGSMRALRLQPDPQPLAAGEVLLKYTSPSGQGAPQLGAESFFFEEGQGKRYERAAYGALRVDAQGNSLLAGLCDSTGIQL